MSHEEVIHKLYIQWLELNFDETYMLLKKLSPGRKRRL